MGQQNSCKTYASHAPQLRSCNYYLFCCSQDVTCLNRANIMTVIVYNKLTNIEYFSSYMILVQSVYRVLLHRSAGPFTSFPAAADGPTYWHCLGCWTQCS